MSRPTMNTEEALRIIKAMESRGDKSKIDKKRLAEAKRALESSGIQRVRG